MMGLKARLTIIGSLDREGAKIKTPAEAGVFILMTESLSRSFFS